ncbi:hypothetical protein [Desulfosporosinus fructosivorans]
MENKATIIAVAGVVAIGIGIIASGTFTGQGADPELLKQVVTGLIGFASGAAAGYVVAPKKSE